MARFAIFALASALALSLLLAGCTISPEEQASKLLCANGTAVSDFSRCAPPITQPAPNETNATPEPQPAPRPPPTPTPTPAPQPAIECGNGICSSNESFGSCPQDCAPTYRYLYEYGEALDYAYFRCDRIGDRVNCWTETTYVERAEPVYLPNSLNTLYSVYNSFMLRIINGSAGEDRPIKMWVNNTSSECLRIMEPVPSVNVFYNASPSDKFYACPKILSLEYLGDEDVNVPLGSFPHAQKFKLTYLPEPSNPLSGSESMVVWKTHAPYPASADYKFTVKGNVLVPVKFERQWSYINSQGMEIHVYSNGTLSKYVEPLDFGTDTRTGQSVG